MPDLRPYISQIDELMAEVRQGFCPDTEWVPLQVERQRAWLSRIDAARREILLKAELAIVNEKLEKLGIERQKIVAGPSVTAI